MPPRRRQAMSPRLPRRSPRLALLQTRPGVASAGALLAVEEPDRPICKRPAGAQNASLASTEHMCSRPPSKLWPSKRWPWVFQCAGSGEGSGAFLAGNSSDRESQRGDDKLFWIDVIGSPARSAEDPVVGEDDAALPASFENACFEMNGGEALHSFEHTCSEMNGGKTLRGCGETEPTTMNDKQELIGDEVAMDGEIPQWFPQWFKNTCSEMDGGETPRCSDDLI